MKASPAVTVNSASAGPGAWRPVAFAMFAIAWGANQFVSMIIAYRLHAGVTVGTAEMLVGVYALGLIPSLLIGGPLADRYGRATVLKPSLVLSLIATIVLIFGAHSVLALVIGRLLAGVASGGAFAAGTAWVKELSETPWASAAAGASPGARRAAVFLSLGFGLGPVTAGLIAQWAPDPLVSAYLPHLAVIAIAIPWLFRAAPETITGIDATSDGPSLWARLRVPAAAHPRFVGVVAPLAPGVFLAATVSFAVMPSVVSTKTGGLQVAFAALIAGVTLGVGVGIQSLGRRMAGPRLYGASGALLGMTSLLVGLLLAAIAAHVVAPWLVVVTALFFGAGYGLSLVSGLVEVQRIAAPTELAGLTAVYYALTYLGFAAPVVLANLAKVWSYETLLLATALVQVAAIGVVFVRARATAA